MKIKLLTVLVAIVAIFSGAVLTSCGNDEPASPRAKTTTAEPSVYFVGSMLDLFDITCTINGQTTVLTRDNTTKVTHSLRTLRQYKLSTITYSKFPASCKASITCKLKDGVDLSSLFRSDYCLYAHMTYGNDNNNTWATQYNGTADLNYEDNVDWSDMTSSEITKKYCKTRSVEVTFTTANDVVCEYSK